MKTLCLIMLFHASLQLQCDKKQITAHIGEEFTLICKYDTSHFLYSKKYWCRGNSRNTCTILVDSEGGAKNSRRSQMVDVRKQGLFIKVTNLQLDDTGVYWVGIDKLYADIMTSVNVVVTEVPVSKPRLWPLSSLAARLTCWGQPVTVRCGCTKGTGVHYAWYQNTDHEDVLLHHSSHLHLHCSTVERDSNYHCVGSNRISSQRSDVVSVQVLVHANSSCIYVINVQGQPFYDCADRMSTTTAKSPPLTTFQATIKIHTRNHSLRINQTRDRAWTGVPFWYELLRWGSFASLLSFLCLFVSCTKERHKHARRERRLHYRHFAQRLGGFQ